MPGQVATPQPAAPFAGWERSSGPIHGAGAAAGAAPAPARLKTAAAARVIRSRRIRLQTPRRHGSFPSAAGAALDGARDVDARGGAELREDVAQVRFDRLLAQVELARDLPIGLA